MDTSSNVPVLMYDSETMIQKEEERSRIRVVQMDKFRGLLGIDKAPNAQIRELCRVTKGIDEKIGVLRWFRPVERM